MSNVVLLHPDIEDKIDMDVRAFKDDIIVPALRTVGMWSLSAEQLLLGTALAESNLNFVKQIGGGGAMSFFQIEKATYLDIMRYLRRSDNKGLKDRIMTACYIEVFPEPTAMIWNMRLACLMARVKYLMVPEPLPLPYDIDGFAQYWKRYYNTKEGKGTVEHYIKSWRARGL